MSVKRTGSFIEWLYASMSKTQSCIKPEKGKEKKRKKKRKRYNEISFSFHELEI